LEKKFKINEQIKAEKVRLLDEENKNLGIFSLEEALKICRERGLDLILITEKGDFPVCKIGDFGKFIYQLRKKEKEKKKTTKGSIMKTIRLSFNIAPHDIQIKANQAEKFLEEGFRVRVEMRLKGREKNFSEIAKEKLTNFLKILENSKNVKRIQDIKKESFGFSAELKKQ